MPLGVTQLPTTLLQAYSNVPNSYLPSTALGFNTGSDFVNTAFIPVLWNLTSGKPIVNVRAAVTRPAAGGSISHFSAAISFSVRNVGPSPFLATLNLWDGPGMAGGAGTGAPGTLLWTISNYLNPNDPVWAAFYNAISFEGTGNNPMTLEFDSAGFGGVYQTVNLSGFDGN